MANDRVSCGIVLIATALKILLIPAYRSTDFEVHRNWLAITHTRPWREWYVDGASPSEWTLDYPPIFAAFEWALSHVARLFDPGMLDPEALHYASPQTILFQRLSVIVSEFFLLAIVGFYVASKEKLPPVRRRLALFLVALHPGLIIVDHIHFQYNGILLGIFVLSLWAIASEQHLLGAFSFSSLLCAKHIFLYAAPAYFVYLLRQSCRGPNALVRLVVLGMFTMAPVALSFGPYIAAGQLSHVLSRMFPVSRGLLHAYWAPNFWALYAFADKVLAAVLHRVIAGFLYLLSRPAVLSGGSAGHTLQARFLHRLTLLEQGSGGSARLTGGLIGLARFSVLPQVTSGVTALCTLGAMIPCLAATWHSPAPGKFARAAVHCTLCAFLFGYHVHEKAILMIVVPLALLAAGVKDGMAARDYAFLSTVGTYSLFPLLIRYEEYGIKVLLLVFHLLVSLPWLRDPMYWNALGRCEAAKTASLGMEAHPDQLDTPTEKTRRRLSGRQRNDMAIKRDAGTDRHGHDRLSKHAWRPASRSRPKLLSKAQEVYLYGVIVVELYCAVVHPLVFELDRLPFLPLMLTSVYCAAGVAWCWFDMVLRYCVDLGWVDPGAQRTQRIQPQQLAWVGRGPRHAPKSNQDGIQAAILETESRDTARKAATRRRSKTVAASQ